MKKVGFAAVMMAGAVVVAAVLVEGYKIVELGLSVVRANDPGVQLEATRDAAAPLLRAIGGR